MATAFNLPGASVIAVTGSSTDVQNAINTAETMASGTTVIIPAGEWVWTAQVTMTDKINIVGHGATETSILQESDFLGFQGLLEVDCKNRANMVIEGFGMTGTGNRSLRTHAIRLNGQVNDALLGQFKFTKFGEAGIGFYAQFGTNKNLAPAQACVYDVEASSIYRKGTGDTGYPVVVYGPSIEIANPTPGGLTGFVYVEDCTFGNSWIPVSSNNSSRYVCRNSVLTIFIGDPVIAFQNGVHAAMTDQHGLGAWPFSSQHAEVYDNDIKCEGFQLHTFQGGSLIYTDNIVDEISPGALNRGVSAATYSNYSGTWPYLGHSWNNTFPGSIAQIQDVGSGAPVDSLKTTAWPSFTKATYPHTLRTNSIVQTDVIVEEFVSVGDITFFEQYYVDVQEGVHNLETDAINLGLITNATPPTAADAVPHFNGTGTTNVGANEVSGGTEYVAGGKAIANPTVTLATGTGVFDGDPVSWAIDASGPTDIFWAVIYNSTLASNRAIAFVQLGTTDVSLRDGTLQITWNASGIGALQAA